MIEGRNLKAGKERSLKLVRSKPKKIEQRDRHKLLVNDDGSLVADFDPRFVTLHTHEESIVMSWPEAVELALAIAMHARLPM